MKPTNTTFAGTLLLVLLLVTTACKSSSEQTFAITSVVTTKTEMNDAWDAEPDATVAAIFEPYKEQINSIMSPVVGVSAMEMTGHRPESLLSNLVADVLRAAALQHTGQPADAAVMNVGGLRAALPEGDVTFGHIFEILPFENSLCVLTLKGSVVRELAENIVSARGEGISNLKITATKDGKLKSCTIGGRPIDDNKTYRVATIDYLAGGNDKMVAFKKALNSECFPQATVRSLFLEYVQELTRRGEKISSTVEGRYSIVQ